MKKIYTSRLCILKQILTLLDGLLLDVTDSTSDRRRLSESASLNKKLNAEKEKEIKEVVSPPATPPDSPRSVAEEDVGVFIYFGSLEEKSLQDFSSA